MFIINGIIELHKYLWDNREQDWAWILLLGCLYSIGLLILLPIILILPISLFVFVISILF